MARAEGTDLIKTTIRINRDDYKRLKSSLVMRDRSFSEWVQIIMRDYLLKESEKNKK